MPTPTVETRDDCDACRRGQPCTGAASAPGVTGAPGGRRRRASTPITGAQITPAGRRIVPRDQIPHLTTGDHLPELSRLAGKARPARGLREVTDPVLHGIYLHEDDARWDAPLRQAIVLRVSPLVVAHMSMGLPQYEGGRLYLPERWTETRVVPMRRAATFGTDGEPTPDADPTAWMGWYKGYDDLPVSMLDGITWRVFRDGARYGWEVYRKFRDGKDVIASGKAATVAKAKIALVAEHDRMHAPPTEGPPPTSRTRGERRSPARDRNRQGSTATAVRDRERQKKARDEALENLDTLDRGGFPPDTGARSSRRKADRGVELYDWKDDGRPGRYAKTTDGASTGRHRYDWKAEGGHHHAVTPDGRMLQAYPSDETPGFSWAVSAPDYRGMPQRGVIVAKGTGEKTLERAMDQAEAAVPPRGTYGTGAVARVPASLEKWIGTVYGFGSRGLAPVREPRPGSVYLTVAEPAAGLHAVLATGKGPKGGTGVAWLTGARAGQPGEIFGGTFWSTVVADRQTTMDLSTPRGQTSMFSTRGTDGARPVTGAPPVILDSWRKSMTAYLASIRKGAPSTAARDALWQQAITIAQMYGLDTSDPYWAAREPRIHADADAWWTRELPRGDSAATLEVLGAEARAALSKLKALHARQRSDPAAVTAYLTVVLKLIQAEQKIRALQPEPAAASPRGRRIPATRDVCRPPRGKRTGPDARCRGDWDTVQACIIREGGLRADQPEVGELAAAAGGRNRLNLKLISPRGQTWGRIAEALTSQGYIEPDDHGRTDEAAVLEFVVDALRGGRQTADPRLNACAYRRLEEGTVEPDADPGTSGRRRSRADAEAIVRANHPSAAYMIPHLDDAEVRTMARGSERFVRENARAATRKTASRPAAASAAEIRRAVERATRDLPPGDYEVTIG